MFIVLLPYWKWAQDMKQNEIFQSLIYNHAVHSGVKELKVITWLKVLLLFYIYTKSPGKLACLTSCKKEKERQSGAVW